MQAAEVAKERVESEIYKSGIGKMADIDARLTLLAGSAEESALRGREDYVKGLCARRAKPQRERQKI